MNKNVYKIDITTATKGKELWKLNKRKGFYNFIKYVTDEDIKNLQKKEKGCQIIDKTKNKVVALCESIA